MARADAYQVDSFWRNGFAKVKGVFSREEVMAWREAVLADPDRSHDMLSDRALRGVLLHPKVVALARQILGSQEIVYFGDSSINVGPQPAGFHKDNVDKDDQKGPDWQGRYPIIRFGLYMQDHTRNPDGLDLREGSHETCSTHVGRHVYGDTAVGDLMVWNLRTSHSGCGMMLKTGTPINPQSPLGKVLRRYPLGLLKTSPIERVAVFWTMGVPGPAVDRYIACHRQREYAHEIWMNSEYDEEALAAAREAGVIVRDVRSDLIANPPPRLHKYHVPFPY